LALFFLCIVIGSTASAPDGSSPRGSKQVLAIGCSLALVLTLIFDFFE
jgi:hypothetical protein